jgi:Transcription factor WhiB/Sigma-70, region 4
MTVAMTRPAPSCTAATEVFCNPLLEEPLPSSATGAQRQARNVLEARAKETCTSCPLFAQCLFDAIVTHDVYGFVAGTTARQRQEIRAELEVTVEPDDFDTLAGVTSPNRQIDHDEVVRLRTTNPHESLESIAQRLGCSLSTVKRHLRRARNGEVAPRQELRRPTIEEVLDVYDSVVSTAGASSTRRRAA